MKRLLFVFLSVFLISCIYSQPNIQAGSGNVSGKTYDSTRNILLRQATVAIYIDSSESVLVKYTLTDEFGEFSIDNLPFNKRFRMVISYAGYSTYSVKFLLNPQNPSISFSKIFMEQQAVDLGNVTVKYIPPVRYNRDTLEFNADAFKLGSANVLEDLLKKLPGFVLWGDGSITVNGRTVNSVMVDGKPFMGGSFKAATNNLPASIIDKIQVYQQKESKQFPTDSITNVNVKLKKDKNRGLFGKQNIELSNSNYDFLSTLNYFSPRVQFSVLGNRNNVNRISNSVKTIIENSLFKNGAVTFDYQPDFRMVGISKISEYGLLFQAETREPISINDFSRLNSEYYGNSVSTITKSSRESLSRLPSTDIRQISHSLGDRTSKRDEFSAKFENSKAKGNLIAEIKFERKKLKQWADNIDSVFDNARVLKSYGSNNSIENKRSDLLGFNIRYFSPVASNKKLLLNNSFSYGNNNDDNKFSNFFRTSNSYISANRLINFRSSTFKWNSNFAYENIRISHYFRMDINADFAIKNNNENQNTVKYDSLLQQYINISGLTHNSRFREFEFTPSLKIRLQFESGLSDRFSKSKQFYLNLKTVMLSQDGTSNLENLQYSNALIRPSPELGFKSTLYKANKWLKIFQVNISAFPSRVSKNNFVNLVDSVSLYEINYGNKTLAIPTINELEVILSRTPIGRRDGIKYDIKFVTNIIHNPVVDSVFQKTNGQRDNFVRNGEKSYSSILSGNVSKNFMVKNNNFQVVLNYVSRYDKIPGYLNSAAIHTTSWSNFIRSDFYSYLGKNTSLNIGYSMMLNLFDQRGSALKYKLFNRITSIKFGLNYITKRNTELNSSLYYSHNASSLSGNNPKFIIWNLKLAQRFFNKRNFEISLNAYDLLRSNQNVTYSNTKNGILINNQNTLQQYFSVSLSYYPRVFRK